MIHDLWKRTKIDQTANFLAFWNRPKCYLIDMGAIIETLIYSSEDLQPYSVPDPQDAKNDRLRVNVAWKVFFQYDIDSLLIPNGPIGTYRIEFLPEGRDPIEVTPEPDQRFLFWAFRDEIRRRFPSFYHGFFLQYHLFTKGTDRDKALSPPTQRTVAGFRLE
jgi:hypothetical protein